MRKQKRKLYKKFNHDFKLIKEMEKDFFKNFLNGFKEGRKNQ